MKAMCNHTKSVPVQITNREAITLIKERAQREGRSAANAASVTIIESLGKPTNKNPGQPKFLNDVIVKDGTEKSSAKTE
jgi:hypothetical protein